MGYAVKEIFYTLQGEGRNAGRASVFCRFAGCNLWSGREQDRHKAICQFCDTDFVGMDGTGGGRFVSAGDLAAAIAGCWEGGDVAPRLCVLTGGEPLLQVDAALIDALHSQRFEIALETNGTIAAPHGIDWISVSPKAGTRLEQTQGSELKLVYPQPGIRPESFEKLQFDHFLLQPCDGQEIEANTALAVSYCLQHPNWRLTLQAHKHLGIR